MAGNKLMQAYFGSETKLYFLSETVIELTGYGKYSNYVAYLMTMTINTEAHIN